MLAYIRLIASLHAPTRQGFRTFHFLLSFGGTNRQRNKINIWLRWCYTNLALKQPFSSQKLGKPSKNKVIPQAPFRTLINVYISRTKLHHLYISKTRQIPNLLFSTGLLRAVFLAYWLLQSKPFRIYHLPFLRKTYKCLSQFWHFHLLLLLAISLYWLPILFFCAKLGIILLLLFLYILFLTNRNIWYKIE